MNFVYDIEKDDFLNELEVAINPFRWLFGRPHFPNQRASGNLRELTSLGIFTERTKGLPEQTCFRVFTERTKKLAESTSFREFTERKRKLIEPARLRILTERTKQRLWLLLTEIRETKFFNPYRERRRMARTKNTAEKNIQVARSNVC